MVIKASSSGMSANFNKLSLKALAAITDNGEESMICKILIQVCLNLICDQMNTTCNDHLTKYTTTNITDHRLPRNDFARLQYR